MAAALTACSSDVIDAPSVSVVKPVEAEAHIYAESTLPVVASPISLGFSTYDGSGQVVHPDVVTFDQPWNGHKMWNAITPYPNSATKFENPSLYASEDGDTWGIPDGVLNPLSRTDRGYLSDPDMLFDPKSAQMWLYYREVQNVEVRKGVMMHLADHVFLTTSSDAINWSTPREVASDSGRFMVSPSIVRAPDGTMSMYQVDAGRGGCSSRSTRITRRLSANGLDWSAPVAVTFKQPGYIPWHLDVQYIPSRNQYWALVAAYQPERGCTTTSLFFATSADGKNWTTHPTSVLSAGEVAQFGSAVYRSTFSYTAANDGLTIWYSGCSVVRPGTRKKAPVLAWSAAVTHTTATALLNRVDDKTRNIVLAVVSAPGTVVMSATNVP